MTEDDSKRSGQGGSDSEQIRESEAIDLPESVGAEVADSSAGSSLPLATTLPSLANEQVKAKIRDAIASARVEVRVEDAEPEPPGQDEAVRRLGLQRVDTTLSSEMSDALGAEFRGKASIVVQEERLEQLAPSEPAARSAPRSWAATIAMLLAAVIVGLLLSEWLR